MKLMRFAILLMVLVFCMACSININLPTVTTTDPQDFTINEKPLKGTEPGKVTIEMGGGELNITSGAKNLVEGTVRYNVKDWKPTIERNDDSLTITQGENGKITIPNTKAINEWDLQLGEQPMRLEIKAGGYKGKLDLGGLSLSKLNISDGASTCDVDFSEPNKIVMDSFTYKTGASTVEINNLANANAKELLIESGAGSFTFDFNGKLQRDLTVRISSGASDVHLKFPPDANVEIRFSGGISNINTNGTWIVNDSTYSNSGNGPLITVKVEMVLGSVTIERK
ncbi:MAG: hypothetical protein HGA86_02245 [Anaerolineaceae bacterium]|nr:hypothetical protein [Anaerolineaceae bacterium]